MAKKSSSKGLGLEAATASMPRSSAEQRKQEQRWRAESDLRTLRDAELVKSDPARVRLAKQVAQEEIRALSKVRGK